MIFDLIRKRNGNWKDDTLSGLTVALALVPEAIAFSFIAGVNPLVGLWAAVFMGFITASIGGRPGMISGATGAIAVVVAKLVEEGDVFVILNVTHAGFAPTQFSRRVENPQSEVDVGDIVLAVGGVISGTVTVEVVTPPESYAKGIISRGASAVWTTTTM